MRPHRACIYLFSFFGVFLLKCRLCILLTLVTFFSQPEERTRLVNNIVGHLKRAKREIQQRQVKNFLRADREYGSRIAQGLGLDVSRL